VSSSRSPRPSFWTVIALLAAAALAPSSPAAAEEKAGAPAPSYRIVLHDQAPYFEPHRLQVEPGSTVTWENRGPGLIHTVVVASASGDVHSGALMPGKSWSYTFQGDAVVRASCEIHPHMYGIVVVGRPPASLIQAVESRVEPLGSPGLTVDVAEYPLPVPASVPGVLAVDAHGDLWVTLGGGGWGNIAHPPLAKFAHFTADGDLTVYDTPTPASGPSGLILAPDGTLYLTLLMAGKIARFDPRSRTTREFSIPTDPAWPTGLALAADGSLWFNQTKGNKVARLGPDGTISEFPVPTEGAHPTGMGIDSRGRIWIAQRDASKIACLSPDGNFVEYALPTPGAKPTGVLVDRQDRVWFAEREGNRIGVFSDGRIREFPLPNPRSGPFFLAEGPDGRIWFSEIFANRIGSLDPQSGEVVELAVPTPDSWPGGIAFDGQGGLWFTEQLGNKIGHIPDPAGAVRAFLAQKPAPGGPPGAPAPAGGHAGHPH